MKRTLVPAIALLCWTAPATFASQTACIFSAGEAPRYYEIEFIGDSGTDPLVVFASTASGAGKRLTLPPGSYTLRRFDREARAVDLEFRQPENAAEPPSFTLAGTGGRARLKIGPTTIDGELACDF